MHCLCVVNGKRVNGRGRDTGVKVKGKRITVYDKRKTDGKHVDINVNIGCIRRKQCLAVRLLGNNVCFNSFTFDVCLSMNHDGEVEGSL